MATTSVNAVMASAKAAVTHMNMKAVMGSANAAADERRLAQQ